MELSAIHSALVLVATVPVSDPTATQPQLVETTMPLVSVPIVHPYLMGPIQIPHVLDSDVLAKPTETKPTLPALGFCVTQLPMEPTLPPHA